MADYYCSLKKGWLDDEECNKLAKDSKCMIHPCHERLASDAVKKGKHVLPRVMKEE